MKPATYFLLPIHCGCVALYYAAGSVQSVDYHDGQYHPILRERYVITMLVAVVASACCWKIGRRSPAKIDNETDNAV